ncbi:MAG: Ig-like domain-containing protein [Verrucomicrobia bacterium]|nr:Ig-like domain-containing protein [Verrucomicrobiota bacterium]
MRNIRSLFCIHGFYWFILISHGSTNSLPNVTIVFPPDNVRVRWLTGVALRADASALVGTIQEVQFFSDTNFIGSASFPPYTNLFSAWPEGILTLTAVAIDNAGARATSAPVHVIAQQPPTTSRLIITSPANHAILPALVPFTIEANLVTTDGREWPAAFFNGTNLIGEVAEPPYRLTVSNLLAGDYTFRVHVDTGGRYAPFYTNDFNPITIHVAPLLLQSPSLTQTNGLQFEVAGDIVLKTNLIEASLDLLNWLPLQTNVPNENSFLFLDTEATNYSRRFYRVRLGP